MDSLKSTEMTGNLMCEGGKKEGKRQNISILHNRRNIPILVDFNTSLEGIFFFNSCNVSTRFSLVWLGSSNIVFHLFMSSTTTTLWEKEKSFGKWNIFIIKTSAFTWANGAPIDMWIIDYDLKPQMMGNCLKADPAYCKSGRELHLLGKVQVLILPCQTPLGT